ncbi:hypothetical protein B0O99DRAFT_293482 [Bisporella sp. PMI_857]|nr:hypothetical protein B0O99DRAFT_293482 [Bisporella sp. PMI_857]
MTNPGDILNAFQGVMTSYSEAMECDIFHGLPTNFLLHGLLFRSYHAAERRKGFPSWSWAGWQSAHNYSPPLPLSDMFQYIVYVDWQLKLASDINFYRIRQDDTSKIELIPSLVNQAGHPTRLKHSPQPSIWYNIPDTLSPAERAQLLIFTTTSAIIPVELHQWDDSPENSSILLLSSPASGPVTDISSISGPIDGMDIVPETLEFIFMGDYKEYERDQKHVLIMAIKTDDRGVSERINMASPLLASDWEACPTSERTVYLI